MASHVVARLLQIQQELTDLQSLSKPTPDALQRLQALANELQALQAGPSAPPPPCPPPPPPPVFAGYNNFFPQYGAELPGCGQCGQCDLCYDPCAPAACGNPLPLSVFQGPNGCAPAYTIQGPPGLIGPAGPTGPEGPGGGGGGFATLEDSCNGGTLYYERVPNTFDSIGLITAGPLVRNIPNIANTFNSPSLSITGGNCRGQYATDLQATRTLATEVASGTGAVIAGGANNLSDGFYANVVGGNGNWVNQSTWADNLAFYANIESSIGGVTITYNPYIPIDVSYIPDPETGETTVITINPNITADSENDRNFALFLFFSSVPGGSILGGQGNTIYPAIQFPLISTLPTTSQNIILGGVSNSITGCYSSILNGLYNTINDSFENQEEEVRLTGFNTVVNGQGNVLTGCSNVVVSGGTNTVTNSFSTQVHGEGNVVDLSNNSAICSGENNSIISANYSVICGGEDNRITNNFCFLAGRGLTTFSEGQTAVGRYNDPTNFSGDPPNPRIFMVGGGNSGAPVNLFSVTADGNAHISGSLYTTAGADYAEYFESDTDVVSLVIPGKTVVINSDTGKVRPATEGVPQILGVVRPKRAAMSIIGNTAEDYWHDKYLSDDMGQPVYTGTYVAPPTGTSSPWNTYQRTSSTGTYREVRMLNPAYNPSVPYTPRSARPEWNPIGLLGRVLLIPGQPVSPKWIRLRAYNSKYDEWYITP